MIKNNKKHQNKSNYEGASTHLGTGPSIQQESNSENGEMNCK